MTIKAIMVDIDGTLLNSKHQVTPATKQAIKQVRQKGILFGIATGRDTASVLRMIKVWDIEDDVDLIVGLGGGEIYHHDTHTIASYYPLSGKDALTIVNHFKDMNVNFAIPDHGEFYTPQDDELIAMLAQGNKTTYHVVDYHDYLKLDRAKLIIITPAQLMPEVQARSQTFSIDNVRCYPTAAVLFEYMDGRISKSFGLKKAMDIRGLSMEELCCFGDADNDYEMIRDAGTGVVMGNGSDYTKSVADFITDDNDNDGIAKFINEYIL